MIMHGYDVAYGQRLTERELAILDGLARGRTMPEIAQRLGVKQSTVKTHANRLKVKLGADNTAHAVALGFVSGYLRVEKRVKS